MSTSFYAAVEAGWLTSLLEDRLSVVAEVGWTRPRAAGVLADPRLIGDQGGAYSEGNSEVGLLLSAVYRFAEASAILW